MFKEVKDEGQKCIFTKETLTGSVQKAQLVAGGFEELQVSELQKAALQSLFGSSATCGSDLSKTVDTSFYGHKICISTGKGNITFSSSLLLRPDREGTLWKWVSGLADASLYWFNRLKNVVLRAS